MPPTSPPRKLEKALLYGDEVRELMLELGKALSCPLCTRTLDHGEAVVLDTRDGRIHLTCMGCHQRPISISCPTPSCNRKMDVAPIREACGSAHGPEEEERERQSGTGDTSSTTTAPSTRPGWYTLSPPTYNVIQASHPPPLLTPVPFIVEDEDDDDEIGPEEGGE